MDSRDSDKLNRGFTSIDKYVANPLLVRNYNYSNIPHLIFIYYCIQCARGWHPPSPTGFSHLSLNFAATTGKRFIELFCRARAGALELSQKCELINEVKSVNF